VIPRHPFCIAAAYLGVIASYLALVAVLGICAGTPERCRCPDPPPPAPSAHLAPLRIPPA